jgi:pyridoxamine 5'-phosphate oxidase
LIGLAGDSSQARQNHAQYGRQFVFTNRRPGMSIADLRKEYMRASLDEEDTDENPIVQFERWFHEALQADVPEPNAMSVATVGTNGRPSCRILLLKDVSPQGFTWFTNYESRKGRELEATPYAALLFFWIELERQVRIEGRVERVSEADSDAYFQSRPLGSRIGAIASAQSRPIDNRQTLEHQFLHTEQQQGENPARPAHWGGYRLLPDSIEFWQGRSSRLHDRILYTLHEGRWQRRRLQP